MNNLRVIRHLLGCLVVVLTLSACTLTEEVAQLNVGPPPLSTPPVPTQPLVPQPLISIPLAGSTTVAAAEISGMAWYTKSDGADVLVMLPQYPSRMALGDGAFLLLDKTEIVDVLAGRQSDPLMPRLLPIEIPGLRQAIPGYEGFESITFVGDQIYATIEADLGIPMLGWIVPGEMVTDAQGMRARFDVQRAVSIAPQADIDNMTDEAVLAVPRMMGEGAEGAEVQGKEAEGAEVDLLTFYEANGRFVNADPVVHRFGPDLTPLGTLPFVNVEYRITDVSSLSEDGRFWAINYFFPGDIFLLRRADQLGQLEPVEQLLEFAYTPEGITRTMTRPIRFELLPDGTARNWEGLVALDDQGFLVVTDRFPATILAFVARP